MSTMLAIDQGSNECGFAYFDGETIRDIDVMRPRSSMAWAERMDYIAEQLIHATYTRKWEPEVVAIEDVVLYVGRPGLSATANVRAVLTMGETRGYLKRLVRELWPKARIIDIPPASTKAAAGAPRDRIGAKAHTKMVVAAAMKITDIDENAADAVAIGWAAIARLKIERMEGLA